MTANPKHETGRETVTIALKHPAGIVLQAYEKEDGYEPVLGGGQRKTKVFRPIGEGYEVYGTATKTNEAPRTRIVCGYAMTAGIPKDVWESWLKTHPDSPLVKNNLIMAYDSTDKASGFAMEGAKLRHGAEPLAMRGDPRTPKRRTREGKIEDSVGISDEQAKAVAA